ncbi:hypothetical protein DRN73_05365 [Candidatus Pacearchaeota archaeon]|nr:MAG: hypothetical protein DRN73_05365 [Candidatus Pacearchaeota archaeon]
MLERLIDKFYDIFCNGDNRGNYAFRNYREALVEWEKRTQKINEMGLPNGELSLALYMAEYDFIISRLPPQDKNRFNKSLKKKGFIVDEVQEE